MFMLNINLNEVEKHNSRLLGNNYNSRLINVYFVLKISSLNEFSKKWSDFVLDKSEF
jgi:hypothetical protein